MLLEHAVFVCVSKYASMWWDTHPGKAATTEGWTLQSAPGKWRRWVIDQSAGEWNLKLRKVYLQLEIRNIPPVIVGRAEVDNCLIKTGCRILWPIWNLGPEEGGERVADTFHLLEVFSFHRPTVGQLPIAGADQGGGGRYWPRSCSEATCEEF